MKENKRQAFYLSSSPGILSRFPDPRQPLSRKLEGSQGRTDHLLERPTVSPSSKHLHVPEAKSAPGAEQLRDRDGGGTSPRTRRTPAHEPPAPGQARGRHSPDATLQPLSLGAVPTTAQASVASLQPTWS